MRRTRIKRFVNAMANAHDFLFLRQLLFNVSIDIILIPDLPKHLDHPFVGTAMKRPFQCPDS